MAFEYKVLVQSHIVDTTQEQVVGNGSVDEELYIRMIHISNVHASSSAVIEIFLVPHNGTAYGTPAADDRILKRTIAAGEDLTLEYPVPGLILEYKDALEAICDTASAINLVITGGRNY